MSVAVFVCGYVCCLSSLYVCVRHFGSISCLSFVRCHLLVCVFVLRFMCVVLVVFPVLCIVLADV